MEPERRPRRALAMLPGRFAELARLVAMHGDPERFALLHRVAARLRDDPARWQTGIDPEHQRLEKLAREVRVEIHRLEAFARFRPRAHARSERLVAWLEPRHAVLREVASFFVDRFGARQWSILTPRLSIHWDGRRLHDGPGVAQPGPDEVAGGLPGPAPVTTFAGSRR